MTAMSSATPRIVIHAVRSRFGCFVRGRQCRSGEGRLPYRTGRHALGLHEKRVVIRSPSRRLAHTRAADLRSVGPQRAGRRSPARAVLRSPRPPASALGAAAFRASPPGGLVHPNVRDDRRMEEWLVRSSRRRSTPSSPQRSSALSTSGRSFLRNAIVASLAAWISWAPRVECGSLGCGRPTRRSGRVAVAWRAAALHSVCGGSHRRQSVG